MLQLRAIVLLSLVACYSHAPVRNSTPDSSREPVYDEKAVDQPVTPIDLPRPVYPRGLQMAGQCGYVELRYVVGLDGRAEPGTIVAVYATNHEFEKPALDVIRAARFNSARLAGKPVRQRVQQRMTFSVMGGGSC
jgi:TonB family protein